ncbi:MAG: hypothetical protein H7070_12740 [Saprospiraceae bacterium]|nr:hypothetical protein [Pyrinomonadaceae bacterium]
MKQRSLFIFCLILSLTGFVVGQTKTVNNFDLEKYRNQRLRAETDLRENYAKLGFPSPEELAKQNEKDSAERVELSNRLRNERLERERIENERQQIEAEVARYNSEIRNDDVPAYSAGYYSVDGTYSGYGYNGYYRPRYSQRHRFFAPLYRATPVGIYPVASPRRTSRILFVSPRNRRPRWR